MCTFDTHKIYLTWRRSAENQRYFVGVLSKDADNNYSFQYLDEDNLKEAKNDGFTNYPAFNKLDEVYTKDVLEVFSRRLVPSSRLDYNKFLDYWCAGEYKGNNFAILGLTGAKLMTDNFEFIAPHGEIPAVFYTEVSWISKADPKLVNFIKNSSFEDVENKLTLKSESDNKYDKNAVKVLCDNYELGYIKSIHCDNVSNAIKNNRDIKLKVKNIIKNGSLKEVLLRVEIN